MKSVVKITLVDNTGEKFFGEGPCRLLRAVEKTGSLRAAAISMDMAYSKATRLIRQAEAVLGFPLTVRSAGGKDGGGSSLTQEGLLWLQRYEAYRDECIQASSALYRKHFPQTGCVIMASGLSKRFGSNKLMADFCGQPLICRILDATEGLFNQRVVVTRYESVASICQARGIRTVLHGLPYRSDTVRLGLEALEDVDCCMFCPADQPLLSRETIKMLLDQHRAEPDSICRPSWEDSVGSPVCFPKWSFQELMHLPQGSGGGAVIASHPHSVRTVPVTDPFQLADADTPQTLQLLRRLAHDQAK